MYVYWETECCKQVGVDYSKLVGVVSRQGGGEVEVCDTVRVDTKGPYNHGLTHCKHR